MEFVKADELVRRAVSMSAMDEEFGSVTECGMYYAVFANGSGLHDLIEFIEDGEAMTAEELKVLSDSCGCIYSINDQGIWEVTWYDLNQWNQLQADIDELIQWQEEMYASVEDGE